VSYNYFSGEPVTGFKEGRPMLIRTPDCKFTFENFMLCELYSAMASLRIGFELLRDEKVSVDALYGHGGFYIYPGVGQQITAAALDCDVSVMKTAGEGGPYGMALLALYSIMGEGKALEAFLSEKAFKDAECLTVSPLKERKDGFEAFLRKYKEGLTVEESAVKSIKSSAISVEVQPYSPPMLSSIPSSSVSLPPASLIRHAQFQNIIGYLNAKFIS
jgi:sugar (pentulose or hexulose) kinase